MGSRRVSGFLCSGNTFRTSKFEGLDEDYEEYDNALDETNVPSGKN